jgi:hypothetical protein
VGDSGMIRTQVGRHNRPVVVAVYRTPWAIPPRNRSSTHFPSTNTNSDVSRTLEQNLIPLQMLKKPENVYPFRDMQRFHIIFLEILDLE